MCGIGGYIVNRNVERSLKNKRALGWFMTNLFVSSEERGRDASGFSFRDNDNNTFLYKNAVKASQLTHKEDNWLSHFQVSKMCIFHTRSRTTGHESNNLNNHPHDGERNVMVHNGHISNWDTLAKRKNLKMVSECDSEIIIRLYEENPTSSIKQSWENIYNETFGAAAVAILSKNKEKNSLMMSRRVNPIFLVEMPMFHAVVFCSTEEIFRRALTATFGRSSEELMKDNVIVINKRNLEEDKLYIINDELNISTIELDIKKYNSTYSSYNNACTKYHGYGVDEDYFHHISEETKATNHKCPIDSTEFNLMTTSGIFKCDMDKKTLVKVGTEPNVI